MLLEVQSALIGAFVTVAVMTSILLRRRRRRSDVLFAILCVVLILWFVAVFLEGVQDSDGWQRAELATAALIPAAMLRLFAELVPWSTARGRALIRSTYPISGLAVVVAISPLGDAFATRIAVAVYVGASVLLASNQMIKATDLSKGTVEYVRRRYVAIGASLVTFLAIAGEIDAVSLDGSLTATSHLAIMLYVFFLSQVILRDRLLDLNEFIGRMVILAILTILFAGISALLINLGSNTSSRLFNSVVAVIILLTLYEPLKIRLEGKAIELFFREKNRFVYALQDLRREMQHGVLDPVQMSRIVTDTLYDARRATHAAIYLMAPLGNEFLLQARRGAAPVPRVSAQDSAALWKAIMQNRGPLLTERLSEDDRTNRDLLEQLRTASADVLLPFVSADEVLGFLALRDDRSPEPYSTAEIANLMQIAETAATVIWNSKLADRLRERERLATVGAMAAGLAHEIRNPLGAIKGAAEYLDPNQFKGDEEAEFLEVIIEESNRLNSVVSQFLDYARPFRANFEEIHINAVVRKTATLVEAQQSEFGEDRDQKASLVELELDDRVPQIMADGEQLKQVILNLVLNGLDASGNARPVRVRTRYLKARRCVQLRVEDQGAGIPKEDLERIFIPFFTTKQQGTGLGLAVCQRIVLNHGGTIYAESEIGRGTSFVVVLPIAQKEKSGSITGAFARPRPGSTFGSDLPPLEAPRPRPASPAEPKPIAAALPTPDPVES